MSIPDESAFAPTGETDAGGTTPATKDSFVRHVLQLMSGTATAQVITFAAQLIVLKIFDAHTFGVFAVVTSLAAALVTISTWRYDLTIVLPAADSDARHLVRLSTRINTISCLVVLVVLLLTRDQLATWLVRDLSSGDLASRRAAVAGWLPWAAPLAWVTEQVLIAGYWLNRRREYPVMARNKVIQSSGVAGAQIGLGALMSAGVASLVAGQLAGVGLAWAVIWHRIRGSLAAADGPHSEHLLRTYRKMPLLNGPTALADAVRLNGINVLVGAFFSIAALGQFSRAWVLLQAPIALINGALQQVFYQRLSVTPRGQMTATVRRSIVRSAALGVVPFAVIYLLAPVAFAWWDAGFATAGQIASALVPWLYLQFITSPVSNVFLVVGAQLELMVFSFVFAAVPLGLLWWQHDDLLGSVWRVSAAMAALLVVFLGLTLWVCRRYDARVAA